MTVAANDRLSGPYSGNGVTTAFAYDFKVESNTELRVILRSAAGVDVTQTLTSAYTVSGVGVDGGGNVTFLTAPATGEKVIIEAITPKTQTVNYVENDRFPYESHQAAFDKTQRQIQEVQRDADRALKFPHGETVYRLPVKPSETKLLAQTSDGEITHVAVSDVSVSAVALGAGWSDVLGLASASVLDNLAGIRFVTNNAALTALTTATGLADNAFYQTAGGSTERDGREGLWIYDAASSTTANGRTVLAIDGGGAGRFFRLNRERLTANTTYYVNHASGSNNSSGLSTGASAWATITYAWDFIRDWIDLQGYQLIIQVASATFDEVIDCSGPALKGYRDDDSIIIRGDTATPSNCHCSHAGTFNAFNAHDGARLRVEGMKFSNASGTDHCFKVYSGAYVEFGKIEFGASGKAQMQAANGTIVGNNRGSPTVAAAVTFAGNAEIGCLAEVAGKIDLTITAITFSGTPTYTATITSESAWLVCGEQSHVALHSAVFSPTSAAFTGRRFYCNDLGQISELEDLERIPGSVEGVWTCPILTEPQGRLTAEDGVPVSTTDQTAKTSLHYEAYASDYGMFSKNNGAAYEMITIGSAGLSLSLDNDSGHAGYHAADTNFDVFLFRRTTTGNLAMGSGPAWTNATTRSAAISRVNGVYSNTATMTVRFGTGASDTQSLAAGEGVYVGTFRTNGTNGQTEDSLAKRFVWNQYNRLRRPMSVFDGTDSWTAANGAWNKFNNSDTNRIAFVRGLNEDVVSANARVAASFNPAAQGGVGIGLDSTSAFATAGCLPSYDVPTTTGFISMDSTYEALPGLGFHELVPLHYTPGSGTNTFYGDAGVTTLVKSGITGTVMA